MWPNLRTPGRERDGGRICGAGEGAPGGPKDGAGGQGDEIEDRIDTQDESAIKRRQKGSSAHTGRAHKVGTDREDSFVLAWPTVASVIRYAVAASAERERERIPRGGALAAGIKIMRTWL